MVQFKDCFLGREQRAYVRAASSQRCVRAGGKHNDLENVGYTARHHTFFEMLGNFSFGDYFKHDAIRFAWEFLTGVLALPREKLWVTVYQDDLEAEKIWIEEIGVPAERCVRLGEKSNFWSMGDTGPCGPCTEIFYDHGPEVAGGPPGSPDEDGDRYIEIWNLVFMQFERSADGRMTPLPKPSVDTGMGLERIAAVMQHVHSNYEIDLFRRLLDAAQEVTGATDPASPSLRVIADHIRSCAFLVSDGVLPSNEGRGYVLRRILRRACRHGHKLGAQDTFFHKLVGPLAEAMGDAYPELHEKRAQIEKVLLLEEEQFARTLDTGMRILEQDIAALAGDTLDGDTVFKLYDTYGFPMDLTADIARERGLRVDEEGFGRAMQAQRERARGASQFAAEQYGDAGVDIPTVFTGYEALAGEARVLALLREGQRVDRLAEGEKGIVVLDRTPFYAESGGQAGDAGVIEADGCRFEVRDTTKAGAIALHHGAMARGTLAVGAAVGARVEPGIRQATALNHSATHLLHAALRQVLGEHVAQKGSLVDAERLRFDFSHFEAMTPEQIRAVERLVNEQIRANSAVEIQVTDMDTAKAKGAMALFGEKYGDEVRVLTMGGGFSVELCGGTHVQRTGDIGLMRVTGESGIAAGVRRIEAVTGANALALLRRAGSAQRPRCTPRESGARQRGGKGRATDRHQPPAREGAREAARAARQRHGQGPRGRRGGDRRREGAGGAPGRRRREEPAHDHGPAEGQARQGRDPAGGGGGRQGLAGGRRDAGPRGPRARRGPDGRDRPHARRQGRRPCRHGAGRRHRCLRAAAGAGARAGMGAGAAGLSAAGRSARRRHAAGWTRHSNEDE